MTGAARAAVAAATFASCCGGCAVPRYDVPYVAGAPAVHSIMERVECELLDLVKDGTQEHEWLLTGDYQVAAALSLEVNDTGGLAPSFSLIDPIGAGSFAFGGSGTLSQSRDHNFTENLQYSLREIYLQWRDHPGAYECPAADTNLAGKLGISDFVDMALDSQGLAEDQKSPFGGSIQFLVTKSVSAVGPSWTLVRFKGPGGVNMSEINTDKITLAFAKGPKQGTKLVVTHAFNKDAYLFLQQLLNSSVNNQLLNLQYLNQNAAPSWLNLLPVH